MWRLDSNLGNYVWQGESFTGFEPMTPSPHISPPMVSIEHWIHADSGPAPLLCHLCDTEFKSMGMLIELYTRLHDLEGVDTTAREHESLGEETHLSDC